WPSFELVEYLEHHICGLDYTLKMARKRELSCETRQSILVLRNEGYSMREMAKNLDISYNGVYYSLQRTAQMGSNRVEREVGGPGAQLSKKTRILESLVREIDASRVLNWQLL